MLDQQITADKSSAGAASDTNTVDRALKPAHLKRLRFIFSKGRPVHVGTLGPMDLDLLAAGMLKCPTVDDVLGRSASAVLAITELGVRTLKVDLDARRAVCDVHHTLGGRLAHWLRETKGRMTWENVTFDRDYSTRLALDELDGWYQARLDVVACAVTPTARLADIAAYEVKVSVADFRADLANPKKLAASRDIAQAAWYCTPMGLLQPSQLPEGFGLICEGKTGDFTVLKRAKRKKDFEPHRDTLMTLVRRRATVPESAE
ncbi:hypothetical protein [Acidovorax sp.]|uniref:hypothetical protein n=1 Tax=Acidovorax sp. TaxID=1872122 RepID=UPI00391EEA9B